jgi:hypothetical protein
LKRNNLKITFYSSFLFFLLIKSGNSFSQTSEKLKFKKDNSLVYFFQTGSKSDTVFKSANNRFYLSVPDSLKLSISIQVENAQLISESDSIVKLNYIPGIKYESLYIQIKNHSSKIQKQYEFKTLVNGTSGYKRDRILIRLIDRRENSLILENEFFYR